MSAQPDLAFQPIAQPEAGAVATRPTTIAEAALALFSPHEATMLALAEKYRNVAFDLSTPKGLKAAKDARLELREQGRFAIQRLRDKTKDQLNDCKKVVESEATRLIALVEPVENAVHQQITAHEEKLAAEKAERDRIEAERKQKHLDAIAVIASYVDKAQGLPVDRVEAGIAYVQAIDVSADVFEEFAARAAEQKQVTIERLQKMVADLKAAAEAERLRLENEELKRRLEAAQQSAATPAAPVATQPTGPADEACRPETAKETAQVGTESADIAHAQETAIGVGEDAKHAGDLQGPEDTPQQDSQQVLKAEAATPDATDREPPAIGSPVGGPMGAGQPAAAGPSDATLQWTEAERAELAQQGADALRINLIGADFGLSADASAFVANTGYLGGVALEGDDGLLAQCLELTEYAAAPFSGRFPSHPKPGPDWWAGLRERIELLQPMLRQATADH
jgi:regulator of replication initiation timing